MQKISKIFLLCQPVPLILVLLEYGLGLGLARYLGATTAPEVQFFGGAIAVFVLAASNLMVEHFRPVNEPIVAGETRAGREEMGLYLLWISLAFLAAAAGLAFLLLRGGYLQIESGGLLLVMVLLALAIAVPPLRLVNRGLGELSRAVLIASLVPTWSFALQFGSLNRLLTLFVFPLFMLGLAYFLALNFPAYVDDLKYERRSLLLSLTWERAVPIHNILLVAAYLWFAATPFLGVPFGLAWPSLLTLPLAAYQIFTMRNVANGAKPVWTFFIANSTAIFGLTVYVIALTFWLH